jgi:hypothetical protein
MQRAIVGFWDGRTTHQRIRYFSPAHSLLRVWCPDDGEVYVPVAAVAFIAFLRREEDPPLSAVALATPPMRVRVEGRDCELMVRPTRFDESDAASGFHAVPDGPSPFRAFFFFYDPASPRGRLSNTVGT